MKEHLLDHQEKQCDICAKIYTSIKKFNALMKQHSNPMFQCDMCDTKFVRENYLQIHKKEFNYACEQCSYKCVSMKILNCHIKYAHSTEETVTCDICGQKCQNKTKLHYHI